MQPPGAMAPNGQLHGRPRFEAANTTHDGRLTIDQARAANWIGVVRHFQEIDRDQKGYVTWQDIKEFQIAKRAARLQQRGSVPPPPPTGAGAPPPGYYGAPPNAGGPPPGSDMQPPPTPPGSPPSDGPHY
jgi:hypothetical protein